MIISHRHRFVYFAPRKTGTSSVVPVLREHFDAEEFSFGQDLPRHEMNWPTVFESYFTFVSVRNPFSRFASIYNFYFAPNIVDKIEKMPRVSYRTQSIWDCLWGLPPNPGCSRIRLDAVIKLESLEEDFNALPFVRKSVKLHRWNIGSGSRLYGPTLQKLVRDFYAKDFSEFGYDPSDTSVCELRYL